MMCNAISRLMQVGMKIAVHTHTFVYSFILRIRVAIIIEVPRVGHQSEQQ